MPTQNTQPALVGFFYAWNKLMFNPATLALIIGGVALVSFGCGFVVSNWRDSSQIERLEGQKTLLSTAKDKCAADVKNIRGAMDALAQANMELERQAEQAMREAVPQVEERTRTITKIKALPVVELDRQCEAIKKEQIDYVLARRK